MAEADVDHSAPPRLRPAAILLKIVWMDVIIKRGADQFVRLVAQGILARRRHVHKHVVRIAVRNQVACVFGQQAVLHFAAPEARPRFVAAGDVDQRAEVSLQLAIRREARCSGLRDPAQRTVAAYDAIFKLVFLQIVFCFPDRVRDADHVFRADETQSVGNIHFARGGQTLPRGRIQVGAAIVGIGFPHNHRHIVGQAAYHMLRIDGATGSGGHEAVGSFLAKVSAQFPRRESPPATAG